MQYTGCPAFDEEHGNPYGNNDLFDHGFRFAVGRILTSNINPLKRKNKPQMGIIGPDVPELAARFLAHGPIDGSEHPRLANPAAAPCGRAVFST